MSGALGSENYIYLITIYRFICFSLYLDLNRPSFFALNLMIMLHL